MPNLKLLSLNVKGLNSPFKRKALWNDALKFGCDILCIQESHFARDNPPQFSHPKFPHIFASHNSKKKKGVLTIIKDSISFQLLDSKIDQQGRYVILVAKIENTILTLVNIYAPNRNPQQFLQKVITITKKIQKGNIILCGDFNATMDPTLDTTKGIQSKRRGLKNIFSQEDLHDPWRCLHATEKDFTFYSNVHKSYSRIDFFITDRALLQKTTDAHIHNITWSDHAPISLIIDLAQQNSKHVLWRNNTYILSHRGALAEMKERLEEFV